MDKVGEQGCEAIERVLNKVAKSRTGVALWPVYWARFGKMWAQRRSRKQALRGPMQELSFTGRTDEKAFAGFAVRDQAGSVVRPKGVVRLVGPLVWDLPLWEIARWKAAASPKGSSC